MGQRIRMLPDIDAHNRKFVGRYAEKKFTAPTLIARRSTTLTKDQGRYSLCPDCGKKRKFCSC